MVVEDNYHSNEITLYRDRWEIKKKEKERMLDVSELFIGIPCKGISTADDVCKYLARSFPKSFNASALRVIHAIISEDKVDVRSGGRGVIHVIRYLMFLIARDVTYFLNRMTLRNTKYSILNTSVIYEMLAFPEWNKYGMQMLWWIAKHTCIDMSVIANAMRQSNDQYVRERYLQCINLCVITSAFALRNDCIDRRDFADAGDEWGIARILQGLHASGISAVVAGGYVAHLCDPTRKPKYTDIDLYIISDRRSIDIVDIIVGTISSIATTLPSTLRVIPVRDELFVNLRLINAEDQFVGHPIQLIPIKRHNYACWDTYCAIQLVGQFDLDPCCAFVAWDDNTKRCHIYVHPRAQAAYETGTMSLDHRPFANAGDNEMDGRLEKYRNYRVVDIQRFGLQCIEYTVPTLVHKKHEPKARYKYACFSGVDDDQYIGIVTPVVFKKMTVTFSWPLMRDPLEPDKEYAIDNTHITSIGALRTRSLGNGPYEIVAIVTMEQGFILAVIVLAACAYE
jgi:hypothetical protein